MIPTLTAATLSNNGFEFLPMNCCVLVGEPLHWTGERQVFMNSLKDALAALGAEAPPLKWRDAQLGDGRDHGGDDG